MVETRSGAHRRSALCILVEILKGHGFSRIQTDGVAPVLKGHDFSRAADGWSKSLQPLECVRIEGARRERGLLYAAEKGI
jgi:hypothetical protein